MKNTIHLPYPQIDSITVNKEYAHHLLKLFAGINSQMSLFSFLLYTHTITSLEYPDLSQKLAIFIQVNLYHLTLLSKLIFQLGEDPRLWSYEDDLWQYWSPGFNIYPLDYTNIINYLISYKKQCIHQYQNNINIIKDESIQSLLERFILDEKHHITVLKSFL